MHSYALYTLHYSLKMKGYIYYEHTLSIPASLLYEDWGLMSYTNYKQKCFKKQLIRSRDGKGKGNEALLSYHDLPQWIKNVCIERLGSPDAAEYPNELEPYIQPNAAIAEFFSKHRKPDGTGLKMAEQREKATSCFILEAITTLLDDRKVAKGRGKNMTQIWQNISDAVNALNRERWQFKLPKNPRALQRRYNEYLSEGYITFIHKGEGNVNMAKVKDEKQRAFIEEMLFHSNNLNNEQVALWYNVVAQEKGWAPISASTVRVWREKSDFYTLSGRKGSKAFANTRKMLVKRTAPSRAMLYWTMDGWVAELLYRKTEVDKRGYKNTTYHHRPVVVMVIDPSTKYIIGYAIGTAENPPLIKEALRNAFNHTRELFGERYKPHQLQTDNYGKGCLLDIYQASTATYTPAEVGNAKAKVIEPFFGQFNKNNFQRGLAPNWSGFGIKSSGQPNMEWINKNKHFIPDFEGVCMQLIHAIERERRENREAYLNSWATLPESDRLPLSLTDYFQYFGQDTGYTNRYCPMGITPTIGGQLMYFDSFDTEFRKHTQENWLVKYDPDDLSRVLVLNAKSTNGKLKEIIGTKSFILEAKYEQPMALYDRREGDGEQLERIRQYNKQLTEQVITRATDRRNILQNTLALTAGNPELEMLSKALLTDRRGQHKNQLAAQREYAEFEEVEIHQPKQQPLKAISFDEAVIEYDIQSQY